MKHLKVARRGANADASLVEVQVGARPLCFTIEGRVELRVVPEVDVTSGRERIDRGSSGAEISENVAVGDQPDMRSVDVRGGTEPIASLPDTAAVGRRKARLAGAGIDGVVL